MAKLSGTELLDLAIKAIRAEEREKVLIEVRSVVHATETAKGIARSSRRLPPPNRPAGARRTAEDINRMAGELHKYIKAHPGKRVVEIAAALGVATKEIALPMLKLRSEKKVKPKGVKAATTYTVT